MANSANDDLAGCVGLIVVGVVLWLGYDNLPISAYALSAGLAALALRGAEETLAKEGRKSDSFWHRLRDGLVTDGKKVAFWLFIGFALVLLVQMAVNQFRSHVDPNQVLSAELALYEFGDGMAQLASPAIGFLCLGFALLFSILLSTLWPVAALGALRKALSAGIVALAAITSFSFVAIGEAATRYDFATGPIRAAIVEDLGALAQARRDGAAFQWLAAQFSASRPDAQPAVRAWQSYFSAAVDRCAQNEREYRQAYRGRLRQELRQAPASEQDATLVRVLDAYQSIPAYCRSQDVVQRLAEMRAPPLGSAAVQIRPWLPDYPAYFRPPPTAGSGSGEILDNPVVASGGRRLRDLQSLRSSVGAALQREEAARDAARGIAVDAIAELLPGSARGAAGAIVDAWKAVLVEVMAGETAAIVRLRLAWLRRGGALPVDSAAQLRETHSPLSSPLADRPGGSSIEAAVGADMSSLDRPGPVAAAIEAATERAAPRPTTHGGLGHGPIIEPHPRPPIEPPHLRIIPRR